MLDFLNEVLMIEDLEPDAYQMGISGKSGAKMKAPDGGKASIKGDFNALHPRYPKGHPQGGKFMPKGSKDQIQAIAKNTGQSVEKVAAAVGGKAPATEKVKGRVSNKETMRRNLANQADSPIAEKPKRGRVSGKELMRRNQEFDPITANSSETPTKSPANKGKLSKFSGSAGAVGKAQKVLKDKNSTPEQRAKAKASIAKAAGKMRGDAPVVAEKPKRGRISNKEIMARNAGTSAPVPSGSMTQGANRLTGKSRLEALRDTNLASYRASEAGTTGKTRGKIISNLAKSESARTKATPDQVESQREKMAAKANYKRSQKGKGGEFKPKTQVADTPKVSSREMASLTGKAKAKAKGATKGINLNKMKKDAQARKDADMFDISSPKVEVKNPKAFELSNPKAEGKKKLGLTKLTKKEILSSRHESSGAGYGGNTIKGLHSYIAGEAGSTGQTRANIVKKLFESEMARTEKPNQDQREMMMSKARYKQSQKGKGGTLKPSRTKSTYVPTKKDKLDFVRDNAKITRKAKAKGVTKSVNKTSKLKLDKNMKMFDLF